MKEQNPTTPGPHPPNPNPKVEAELHRALDDLETARLKLEFIRETLPVSPNEALMLAGEAEMDEATEMRSVIECVLNDSIYPAIRDLQVVAAMWPHPQAEEKQQEEEESEEKEKEEEEEEP